MYNREKPDWGARDSLKSIRDLARSAFDAIFSRHSEPPVVIPRYLPSKIEAPVTTEAELEREA